MFAYESAVKRAERERECELERNGGREGEREKSVHVCVLVNEYICKNERKCVRVNACMYLSMRYPTYSPHHVLN